MGIGTCPDSAKLMGEKIMDEITTTYRIQAGRHQRTCLVCGTAFIAARPHGRYCSAACKRSALLCKRHQAGRQRRVRRCPRCAKAFIATRSDGLYCSGACRQAMHRRRLVHEGH